MRPASDKRVDQTGCRADQHTTSEDHRETMQVLAPPTFMMSDCHTRADREGAHYTNPQHHPRRPTKDLDELV
jgi:hypothetical protein